VYEVPLTALSGETLDPSLLRGRAVLFVNVASRCGLTPQYEGLQRLHDRYRERGLVVVGVPCDQFAGQEPGTAEEIAAFCADSYSVTFPLTEKLEVNGHARHPAYELLCAHPDGSGVAGDVQWNFEKILVSPRGEPVARFRPTTTPDAEELAAAIEGQLPGGTAPVWLARVAAEVKPGDRVSVTGGAELTVTRTEARFLGRDEFICLIEDTPLRWLAQPVKATVEVKVLSLGGARLPRDGAV
jgi:glutathione peroxidase